MIDRNALISPHFRWGEFIRPGDPDPPADVLANLRDLANALETARRQLGERPIVITSGYRTRAHNIAVGGVANSRHLIGQAADLVVTGMPPRKVQSILEGSWPGGLGAYATWTHLDIGPRRRWRQ